METIPFMEAMGTVQSSLWKLWVPLQFKIWKLWGPSQSNLTKLWKLWGPDQTIVIQIYIMESMGPCNPIYGSHGDHSKTIQTITIHGNYGDHSNPISGSYASKICKPWGPFQTNPLNTFSGRYGDHSRPLQSNVI